MDKTPTSYPKEEILNQPSTGLAELRYSSSSRCRIVGNFIPCFFRTRHLRKAEAAQLKKESLLTAQRKKEESLGPKADAVTKEEQSGEDQSSSGNSTSAGTSVESAADVSGVKKKQYTVNILTEVDTNVAQKQHNSVPAVPVDPQEFAKQERLRKQREKQAKFQLEIEKKKNGLSESAKSAAFKENNLLVEDGLDMWDALSQIPEMGKYDFVGCSSYLFR